MQGTQEAASAGEQGGGPEGLQADPAEVGGDPWGAPLAQEAGATVARAIAASGATPAAVELARRLAELPAEAGALAVLGCAQRLAEQRWRRPVIGDYVLRRLFAGSLFAARKALDLIAAEPALQAISEGFVRAAGPLGGLTLAPREIFIQRLRPTVLTQPCPSDPARRPVLLVPGLEETGRHLMDLAVGLAAAKHEVFVMDAMWAGQTRAAGVPSVPADGALDAGFGAARDVAAVALHVVRQLGVAPVLLGAGTGASAIFMLLMAQVAELTPHGLPAALDAALVSPYLAPGPAWGARLASVLAPLPWARDLPLARLAPRPAGVSPLARAEALAREPVTTRLGALAAVQDGLRAAWALLGRGRRPAGRVAVVHDADDGWACPRTSFRLRAETTLGARVWITGPADGAAARGRLVAARWCLDRLPGAEAVPRVAA